METLNTGIHVDTMWPKLPQQKIAQEQPKKDIMNLKSSTWGGDDAMLRFTDNVLGKRSHKAG